MKNGQSGGRAERGESYKGRRRQGKTGPIHEEIAIRLGGHRTPDGEGRGVQTGGEVK